MITRNGGCIRKIIAALIINDINTEQTKTLTKNVDSPNSHYIIQFYPIEIQQGHIS